jgi:hypothetical protein
MKPVPVPPTIRTVGLITALGPITDTVPRLGVPTPAALLIASHSGITWTANARLCRTSMGCEGYRSVQQPTVR